MKNKNKFLAALTALCLVGTMLPASALAAAPQHLQGCGYVCTHLEHDGDCGYVAAQAGVDCTCGFETAGTGVSTGDDTYITNEDGSYGHRADCGYKAETAGHVCTHEHGKDEWVDVEGCPVALAENPVAISVTLPESEYGDSRYMLSVQCYSDKWTMTSHRGGDTVAFSDDDSKMVISYYVQHQFANGLTFTDQNGTDLRADYSNANGYDGYVITLYRSNYMRDTDIAINVAAASYTLTFQDGGYAFMDGAESRTTYTFPDVTFDPATIPELSGIPDYLGMEGWQVIWGKLGDKGEYTTEELLALDAKLTGDVTLKPIVTPDADYVPTENEIAVDVSEHSAPISITKYGADTLLVKQAGNLDQLILAQDATLSLTGTAVSEANSNSAIKHAVVIGDGVKLKLVTGDLDLSMHWSRANVIQIGADASVDWEILGGTVLTASFANCVALNNGAALTIRGGGSLEAENEGVDRAVIAVPQGAALTIDGASVTATGGGAGIGCDWMSSVKTAGDIQIVNGAHVTAKGGNDSAGIGGGQYGNGGAVTISGPETVVVAEGGGEAAGIGGGGQSSDLHYACAAGTVSITDGATVLAIGKSGAAGIGRGRFATAELAPDAIQIEDGANVTAYTEGRRFAIDVDEAGNSSAGTALVLNGRFAEDELPTSQQGGNPIVVYDRGSDWQTELNIPASTSRNSVFRSFATTVPTAGSYMVRSGAVGHELEHTGYDLLDGDGAYRFTVADGQMTTRDELAFKTFTITATAGANGSVSGAAVTQVAPLGGGYYEFTPDEGYVVDTVTVNGAALDGAPTSYTFHDLTGDQTVEVTFKAIPVAAKYTVTVNYLDSETGAVLAEAYSVELTAGEAYDVTARTGLLVEHYTLDRVEGAAAGTVQGDVTVNVYYTAEKTEEPQPPVGPVDPQPPVDPVDPVDPIDPIDPVDPQPPVAPQPPVDVEEPAEPEIEIADEETPLGDLPELPGTVPADEPEDEVVIVDEEVPLGDLPQTGTTAAQTDPAVTLGMLAVALSVTSAGLALTLGRRKEEEQD